MEASPWSALRVSGRRSAGTFSSRNPDQPDGRFGLAPKAGGQGVVGALHIVARDLIR